MSSLQGGTLPQSKQQKRKEQPSIHSSRPKRRKVSIRSKTQSTPQELNISKWWRRMERSEKRNPNRLDTNPKPKRKSRKCTEWKLGYLSLWWMRMDRECHAQRALKEENKMKSSLSKFFFRNNDTKRNNTHNLQDIDITPEQATAKLSSRPVDCHSRTTPAEEEITDVIQECPSTPTLSKYSSLASITPGKRKKCIMDGESESPAKFSREGPYSNYASNITHNMTSKMDNTQGRGIVSELIRERTQQNLEIKEDNSSISAAIFDTEPMNINLEGR
jgi:hypothetical protein